MNEGIPKMFSSESNSREVIPTELKHAYVRDFVIGGLGVALVATSAMYKDETGNTLLEKGFDEIASKNVDARVAELSPDDRVAYNALSNILYVKVGAAGVGRIVNREQLANTQEYIGLEHVPTISGFELTGIISNEDVQKTIGENFFPIGWVTNRINSIVYKPQKVVREGAITTLGQNFRGPQMDDIVFLDLKLSGVPSQETERVKYRTINMLLRTLRHEVCHSNDWETTQQRTFAERTSLLGKIIERVESDDSYNEHLVTNEEGDTKKYHLSFGYESKNERNLAYREYFADICEGYLRNPAQFQEMYPKDYEIIYSWIQKTDPNFALRTMPVDPYSPMTGEVLPEWKNIFGLGA